jgi:arsenite methyltransferase
MKNRFYDASRPNYGLDAPGVVRNLIVVSVIGLSIFAATKTHLWSGIVRVPFVADVSLSLSGTGLVLGVLCLLVAAWMLYDSFVGKLVLRDRMLARLAWTGHEVVLDVGCGRGLLLIGAAKLLSSGKAVGIDLWQSEDLSHNQAGATLKNAILEGVADRVTIETGDMRHMPFDDGRFDVIVSRAAIHNLYKVAEREAALQEIVRVLKPGGYALISDIRHIDSYAMCFAQLGCTVQRSGSRLVAFLLMILTWGSLRPGLLIARKATKDPL